MYVTGLLISKISIERNWNECKSKAENERILEMIEEAACTYSIDSFTILFHIVAFSTYQESDPGRKCTFLPSKIKKLSFEGKILMWFGLSFVCGVDVLRS